MLVCFIFYICFFFKILVRVCIVQSLVSSVCKYVEFCSLFIAYSNQTSRKNLTQGIFFFFLLTRKVEMIATKHSTSYCCD